MTVRFDAATGYDLTCKPGVVAVQAYILGRWGQTIDSGCLSRNKLNSGAYSRHNEGRAGDTGIRPIGHPHGEEVAAWLYDHRHELGCQQILYNGRVYSSNNGDGWRRYLTDPHRDHVHWELNWDGARKQTPWFTAPAPPKPEDDMTPEEHAWLKETKSEVKNLGNLVDRLLSETTADGVTHPPNREAANGLLVRLDRWERRLGLAWDGMSADGKRPSLADQGRVFAGWIRERLKSS